jgi:hypothetical protein
MNLTKTQTALAVAALLAAGSAQAATTHTMTDGRFDFKGADGVVTADGHNDVQGVFDLVNGTGSFTTSTNFVGYTWNADVVEMTMNSSFMDGVGTPDEAHSFDWNIESWFISGVAVTCVNMAVSNNCADEQASGGFFLGTAAHSIAYTLDPGQFAAHTLFDWSTNQDIPVLAIMQVTNNPMVDGFMRVASVDLNGNITGNPFGSNPVGLDINGDGVYDAADAALETDVGGINTAANNSYLTGVAMPSCPGCGPFPNQTPIFNGEIVPVAPPIPVPAAVWLFGSGLLGLVGVARRRKA